MGAGTVRSLGVFAGGFGLDAAESVCDADIDALQSLVEKNLIRLAAPLTGRRFTLRIDEVFPGAAYQDLVISELRFSDGKRVFTIDMSREQIYWHADVKSEVGRVVRTVAKEGRLGFWRWTLMLLGIAGTYRKNDSVDVQYDLHGRTAGGAIGSDDRRQVAERGRSAERASKLRGGRGRDRRRAGKHASGTSTSTSQ